MGWNLANFYLLLVTMCSKEELLLVNKLPHFSLKIHFTTWSEVLPVSLAVSIITISKCKTKTILKCIGWFLILHKPLSRIKKKKDVYSRMAVIIWTSFIFSFLLFSEGRRKHLSLRITIGNMGDWKALSLLLLKVHLKLVTHSA